MFGSLEGLYVPSGDGKVDVRINLVVVAVAPAPVGALGVNNPVHGFYDDLFQIGDGGDVHLLAEGVGFAQGIGGYRVVITDFLQGGLFRKDGVFHA